MEVKIGAHTFKVKRSNNWTEEDNYGRLNFSKLEIWIQEGLPKSLAEETLLHEALHAIRELNGITCSDEKEEEHRVQIMAHALYLFLKENAYLK